jgi:hypothetical protein
VLEDHREVPQILWAAFEGSGMFARDTTPAGIHPE